MSIEAKCSACCELTPAGELKSIVVRENNSEFLTGRSIAHFDICQKCFDKMLSALTLKLSDTNCAYKAKQGTKYLVKQGNDYFRTGQIVISLEDSETPYCIAEHKFIEGDFNLKHYNDADYWAMCCYELEEVKDVE